MMKTEDAQNVSGPDDHPIPWRLNLAIAAVQLVALPAILIGAGHVVGWWGVLGLAVVYGVVMNSGYSMLHEAEHNLLHPNRRVNDAVGMALAVFFPAPFHLIRQGHLGHHLRNRSDDEAFDFYFEAENPVWKYLQLYGILTGLYWVVVACSNVLVLFWPGLFKGQNAKLTALDRPTEALFESLNPRYFTLIRLEALAVLLVHGGLIWAFHLPPGRYAAVLFGFGFMWSAMQYVHHFGTERDVRHGSRNLKTVGLLDRIWLNHNWHQNHHRHPTVPWIHLPTLCDSGEKRDNLLPHYFRMWRGPRMSNEHLENRYAGKIIR